IRDGRSFSVRRVTAVQHGNPIFTLSASFQLEQGGIDHQRAMPGVPDPQSLPTFAERLAGYPELIEFMARIPQAFDIRYVDDPPWVQRGLGPRENQPHRIWMKADGALPDDPTLHVCVLTFASDLNLLDSVLIHHGMAARLDPISMASLDHAMWFHRQFRADDWFLYESSSPSASGGRGLATGRFFARDGRLVASVTQEGMIRLPNG
ncbi:MAG TPA: acyl-CoA thioesterase II, partial [Jatrophihabitans sp.]|nr:acyl-CoA thioesterase II [Jatrophihabitans sp.]